MRLALNASEPVVWRPVIRGVERDPVRFDIVPPGDAEAARWRGVLGALGAAVAAASNREPADTEAIQRLHAEQIERLVEMLAPRVVGWSGIEGDGAELECTEANIRRVLGQYHGARVLLLGACLAGGVDPPGESSEAGSASPSPILESRAEKATTTARNARRTTAAAGTGAHGSRERRPVRRINA